MEMRSSQRSNGYIDGIVNLKPHRIGQGQGRLWRHLVKISNRVVTFVRRWFADYCATTAAFNDLASSLAKELDKQIIEVHTLSSSSTMIGRLQVLCQQVGLMVCRCACSRLRRHYGLARSDKSGEVPEDGPR